MDFSLITDEPLNYCVYAHVNKQNGKMYIGISQDVKRRWATQGLHYKACTKFNRAIQKYGWDNFEHIVLIDNISMTMACELEMELIKKYDTINKGYNLTTGGTHGVYDHNIRIYQYDFDGNFIKKWNSTIEAIREYGFGIQDNLSGKVKSAHGYRWSYEYVDKLPPYKITHDHNKAEYPQIPIIAYNLNGNVFREYDGYDDLDAEYDKKIVKLLCEREREYVYNDLIWGYADQITPELVSHIIHNYYSELQDRPRYKYPFRIKQYTLDGEYVNTYDSTYDVQYTLGFNYAVIEHACRGDHDIGFGYLWRFSCDTSPVKSINSLSHSGQSVIQKDLEGNIIAKYSSAMSAARKYTKAKRVNSSQILDVCKGKRLSAYGYLWEFADQEVN